VRQRCVSGAEGLHGEVELPGAGRVDLSGDPDVVALELLMADLAEVGERLAAGTADGDVVEDGIRCAIAVAARCRSLDQRVRTAGGA
jgi:hypothetical protein